MENGKVSKVTEIKVGKTHAHAHTHTHEQTQTPDHQLGLAVFILVEGTSVVEGLAKVQVLSAFP